MDRSFFLWFIFTVTTGRWSALVGFSCERHRVCSGFSVALCIDITGKSLRHIKCAKRTLWRATGEKMIVPHFFGFICLVLEVLFLRTGKGRKLETDRPTDPPRRASLSTKSNRVQRMRRHTTTVPHCKSRGRPAQRDRDEREKSFRKRQGRGRHSES